MEGAVQAELGAEPGDGLGGDLRVQLQLGQVVPGGHLDDEEGEEGGPEEGGDQGENALEDVARHGFPRHPRGGPAPGMSVKLAHFLMKVSSTSREPQMLEMMASGCSPPRRLFQAGW